MQSNYIRGKFILSALTPIAAFISFAGLSAGTSIANAQGAEDGRALEEVVVTSRRYEESVSDAPLAINVLSQGFLENNRIDRQDDIFNYTPGATYESFSKLQPTASLRGLTAPTPGNPSSESSIQTVIDNVVVTKDFMKGAALFDLARVEVLRGPQGTAFGRNASAGLLHFVTNRPDFEESSGSVTATVGSDERFEFDGHYNAPLSDTAAFRVSFNREQEDGQTDGIIFNEGAGEFQNIGGIDGEENTAIRLQLALRPSDTFSANFKLEYSQDRDESPIREFCDPGPGLGGFGLLAPGFVETTIGACDDPFVAFISESNDTVQQNPDTGLGLPDQIEFILDRDILTAVAEFTWTLENDLTITSVTGFMDADTENLSDITGSVADINFQGVTNDGDSLSTEIRIDNSASDSSVKWLAGAYFLTDEETRTETLNFAARDQRAAPFVPTVLFRGGTNETESYSVFGEVSFQLSDRASLTYGGRYLNDDKDYVARASGQGFVNQIAGIPGAGGVGGVCGLIPGPPSAPDDVCPLLTFDDFPISDSWSSFISKLSLDYAVSDTLNAYFLYSEGFKSGAFQPDALNAEQASVITEPEESTNFEIGLKGEGSYFRYAVTLFTITLDDVQTVNQVPIGDAGGFFGAITNVGEISTSGIEFDGAFAVNDRLTISLGFALQDTEIGGVFDDPTGLIDPATGDVVSFSGLRPGGAPDWTYNLAFDYSIPLAGGSTVDLRADFRGRDDVFFQTRNRFEVINGVLEASDDLLRPTINDWGAQAKWTNEAENLSFTLWGKNLAEDVDITNVSPFIGGGINDFAIGFRGKREFGATVNYDF